MTDLHTLVRTSPKGQPFIGTCTKCGIRGLSPGQMNEPCVNPAGLTNAESLAVVLKILGRDQ